ncbi:hypothetical protein OW774_23840 [Klebsiella pneumoniae]
MSLPDRLSGNANPRTGFGDHVLVAVIFMDSGLNMSNVFIQQSLLLENADARSRLNALCISVGFVGGSGGSFFGPFIYKHYGWTATALSGACLSLGALGGCVLRTGATRRPERTALETASQQKGYL